VHIGNVFEFGSNIWIETILKNLVYIGDNVLLAGYDFILSHSFLMQGIAEEGFSPVEIKNGARIGLHCIILSGVTIGENSIIGAGAVVVNDIPPNCLAVGVPAKPVKFFKK
jgi:acetyltransferase-like isoleucine patch superfamily enzyme